MTDTRATPDEIRDRVLADIAARPSIRPYLGEETIVGHRPRRATCRRGHPITGEGKARRCLECWRAWRERRAGVGG